MSVDLNVHEHVMNVLCRHPSRKMLPGIKTYPASGMFRTMNFHNFGKQTTLQNQNQIQSDVIELLLRNQGCFNGQSM